uniref:Uncharacterized protein n=1 Tax=Mycena chlorophos TaxID=658473 RepID=A0ABQ0L000_MYCCL|nr:predicted protein [Mycena chlorophos]
MTSAVRALMRRAARHFLCDWVERLKGKTTVGRCCADEGLRDTRDTPSVLFTRPAALVFVKTETGHGGSSLTWSRDFLLDRGRETLGRKTKTLPTVPRDAQRRLLSRNSGRVAGVRDNGETSSRRSWGRSRKRLASARVGTRLQPKTQFDACGGKQISLSCWPCHRSLSSSSSV